jgi:hypothetical protein
MKNERKKKVELNDIGILHYLGALLGSMGVTLEFVFCSGQVFTNVITLGSRDLAMLGINTRKYKLPMSFFEKH